MSTTDLQERLQKSARTLCWSGSPPSYLMAALLHEAAEAVAERDSWKQRVMDEIGANLAFREAGGALPDEDMRTFCARLVAERDRLQESLNQLTGMKFSDRVHAALVARVINAEVALNELYTAARHMDIERNRHGEPSTPELAQFEEALKRTGQYLRDPGNQSNEDGVCGDCESDKDED